MNVFILSATWAYEGSMVVGVYATEESAEAAMRREKESSYSMANSFNIEKWEVQQ